MKRSDAIRKLTGFMFWNKRLSDADLAEATLKFVLDDLGMLPPGVDAKTSRAITAIYIGGFSYNQWDEDIEKNEKIQAFKKRVAQLRRDHG